MLAAVVPSVNRKWEVREVSTPEPGTNQVVIKMHASGICYTDGHATKGTLGVKFLIVSTLSNYFRVEENGRFLKISHTYIHRLLLRSS